MITDSGESVTRLTLNRKRHIKCDETKPSCQKCVNAGWKCDGYETRSASPPPAGTVAVAKTSAPASALSIASYAIPFRIPGSQKDRQIIHYFCVQGSHDIAGYLDSEFWSKTVLQASHREPVVRQALVSLSSLHLDYVTVGEHGTLRSNILAQYGKALRVLGKRVEKQSAEATRTALICCVLFYCFESTLGNSGAAMHHLNGGLNLISQYGQPRGHEEDDDIKTLSSVFERLDLQATMFNDDRQPVLNLTSDWDRGGLITDGSVRMAFSRLDHAYDSLVKLQNRLFRFLTNSTALKGYDEELIPTGVLKEKQRLMSQFSEWRSKFDDFSHRPEHDSRTTSGMQVLLIHWSVSRMLLEAEYPFNETVFGAAPNIEAEEVIGLASDVLKATGERNASAEAAKSPRRNFSSETGVIAPLFILAMKCSDKSVCDRATELLSVSQRREGLYDSQTMAAIVHQFRDAREKRYFESLGTDKVPNGSLETLFADELGRTMGGGMDRRADYIKQMQSMSPS